ncbi:MAG: protein translocase subunit SecF [Ignavibacteria bacterium]|jgi:preprotein translocase subunit SecF|nr:protein translocase subunit SecF [Ignavibacteria bacterium]
MQIFHNPNINFVGYRKMFLRASIIITIIGIILIPTIGMDFGIDFEGGTEMITEFAKPINTERIRDAVIGLGIEGAEIKSFGGDNQYIIRIKHSGTPASTIAEAIDKAIPDIDMKLIKVDEIGAKIGAETRNQAFIAMGLAMLGLLIYIAFRFEFVYGVGAVFAILHDIIITFVISLIIHRLGVTQIEINQTFLAAILTVIGYSINDTVIIFDRIRENMVVMKGKTISDITNASINETLSRTVITVLTVVIVLVVLIILGGPVLLPFAIVMLLGVVFGTYSSIYIASNVVIILHERKDRAALATATKKA